MDAALTFLVWSLGAIVALVAFATTLILIGLSVAARRAARELKREAAEKAERKAALQAIRTGNYSGRRL